MANAGVATPSPKNSTPAVTSVRSDVFIDSVLPLLENGERRRLKIAARTFRSIGKAWRRLLRGAALLEASQVCLDTFWDTALFRNSPNGRDGETSGGWRRRCPIAWCWWTEVRS